MLTKPEIESLINELLAANRSAAPGIVVRDVANNPPSINVEVRFLTSHTYCCAEPGCHLPRDLSRLPLLAGFTIRWHCIVEEGAQLKCLATLGQSLNSNGYEYEYVTDDSSKFNTQ